MFHRVIGTLVRLIGPKVSGQRAGAECGRPAPAFHSATPPAADTKA